MSDSDSVISQQGLIHRTAVMVTLILAGEAIFLLPFVIVRIFRPTFLDVFGINNLELGIAFSIYGMVAMFAYFLGGPLADRFSSRRLMTVAMLLTALGGISFGAIPSLPIVFFLYGFWGLTTILLFWAALIKVTREWGGVSRQGRAYGLLDGGRGLMAAVLSSVSVAIFAFLLPQEVATATIDQRADALKTIIWIFTAIVVVAALLVWLVVPDSKAILQPKKSSKSSMSGIIKLVRKPRIWLQAIIIICAYVGYKGTDDFSLYARDAFGYDDVAAAEIATLSFWVRPFAAVGAGFIGDYFRSSTVTLFSFMLLILGCLVIASGVLETGVYGFILLTIVGTSAGIYALRGVYFALFQEANIPLVYTGSAVGIVSFIGYTPDVFMGPLMGYLIDHSPGATGHQHVFAVIALFGFVGCVATLLFKYYTKQDYR